MKYIQSKREYKIKIPVGARISASVQTGPGTSPACYTMGTVSLTRV
jgi:hypothetical protein